MSLGLIYIIRKGQVLETNLGIWSHWLCPTYLHTHTHQLEHFHFKCFFDDRVRASKIEMIKMLEDIMQLRIVYVLMTKMDK